MLGTISVILLIVGFIKLIFNPRLDKTSKGDILLHYNKGKHKRSYIFLIKK